MRTVALILDLILISALAGAVSACSTVEARSMPSPSDFQSLEIERMADGTGGKIPTALRDAIMQELEQDLAGYGFAVNGRPEAQAVVRSSVVSCRTSSSNTNKAIPEATASACLVTTVVTDNQTNNIVTKLALATPGLSIVETRGDHASNDIASVASAIAEQLANALGRVRPATASSSEDITARGVHVVYRGNGVFDVGQTVKGSNGGGTAIIDLKHIRHRYDPAVDKDVPYFTNVTLNDVVPALIDHKGRPFARITLYHVNPPLSGLPSKESGVDRGTDFRNASDLVKATYSNYVSPVFTEDAEKRRVASHPIGHFYVKVEIPGYPTILTGMTTIQRADTELADLTLGRGLGIGGVLLTPEPGRLNSAMEAIEELTLRQRELRVVDGLYYKRAGSRNIGPEYLQKDGNVVFARFNVPVKNAKDAMAYFVEFIARDEQNIFGSLINRPNKGTGAGCTPFAISWLEAAGVIPFVAEPTIASSTDTSPESMSTTDFWKYLLRRIDIPWRQIGCDDRLGVDHVIPADYTIYDLLFHHTSRQFIEEASEGLAQKIKDEYGSVAGTLFQFGALTPLRDLVIHSKRKDPDDRGDYGWSKAGDGLAAQFWDNSRFSYWIKELWAKGPRASGIKLMQEGRFRGIEVDDMSVARQQEPFFAEADRMAEKKAELAASGRQASSCEALFRLGIE